MKMGQVTPFRIPYCSNDLTAPDLLSDKDVGSMEVSVKRFEDSTIRKEYAALMREIRERTETAAYAMQDAITDSQGAC